MAVLVYVNTGPNSPLVIDIEWFNFGNGESGDRKYDDFNEGE